MKKLLIGLMIGALLLVAPATALADWTCAKQLGAPGGNFCYGVSSDGQGFFMLENNSGVRVYFFANRLIATTTDLATRSPLMFAHEASVETGLSDLRVTAGNVNLLIHGVETALGHWNQVWLGHQCTECK